jgi:hypothetical protein
MAGHSKFKNIMHRKGRADAQRSKLFSKLSRDITVAAKLGLPDPAMNPRLRLAVNNAKAESLPRDVIQATPEARMFFGLAPDRKWLGWVRFATSSGPFAHFVVMGVRPGGNSSSTLTSRSPYTVMAAVRGMGVAVITNTSGTSSPSPLSRSAARCSTPKRCCSSTTTTPRL